MWALTITLVELNEDFEKEFSNPALVCNKLLLVQAYTDTPCAFTHVRAHSLIRRNRAVAVQDKKVELRVSVFLSVLFVFLGGPIFHELNPTWKVNQPDASPSPNHKLENRGIPRDPIGGHKALVWKVVS